MDDFGLLADWVARAQVLQGGVGTGCARPQLQPTEARQQEVPVEEHTV